MKCKYCGTENEEKALVCKACGADLVEITTNKSSNQTKEKKEIQLQLSPNIDAELAKTEVQLEEEEDIAALINPGNLTGSHTMGNAQAQTIIQTKTPELEIPPSSMQELIAQKEKEKQARDARLAENEEKFKEEHRKKLEDLQPKKKEKKATNKKEIDISSEKLLTVLSHFPIVGWLIAFFASGQRSPEMTEKLNRTLILSILSMLFDFPLLGGLLTILWVVLTAMSLYDVVAEKNMKLPILDDVKIIK